MKEGFYGKYTGIDQEDSALLLVNSYGEMKEFLFISPFDERN